MRDYVSGIREEELGSLSIEVLNRADRIAEIFGEIDVAMERLPDCYNGEPCTKVMERYDELKGYFPVVKENIVSYSDDLAAVVRKMQEGGEALKRMFQKFADEQNGMARAIDS